MKNIIAMLAIALLLLPVVAVRAEQFSGKDGVIFQFTPPGGGFVEKHNPLLSATGVDLSFDKGNITSSPENTSIIFVRHAQLPQIQGNQSLALQQYASEQLPSSWNPADTVDCGVMNGSPTCKLSNLFLLADRYFVQNKHTVFDLMLSPPQTNETYNIFKAFAHSFKVIYTPDIHEIQ